MNTGDPDLWGHLDGNAFRRRMTDAECADADRTLPRGTARQALAGWTGALLVGVGCWGAVAAVVSRAL